MREYSEEFLGNPGHDGDGPPIDYENEEPFRSLDAARRAGKIQVSCLGIGIDALNYFGRKPYGAAAAALGFPRERCTRGYRRSGTG